MAETVSIELRIQNQIRLAIVVNALSLFFSAMVRLQGWTLSLSEQEVNQYGSSLTMLLLVLGLISHMRARASGPLHPGLIAVLGAIAPASAYLGGPLRHLVAYHALTLMIHGFIIWNTHRWRRLQLASPPRDKTQDSDVPDDPEKDA